MAKNRNSFFVRPKAPETSSSVCQGGSQRAFLAAGQADQPGGKLLQIIQRSRALGLGSFAHFEARDELAEVLIAGLRFAK